MSDIELAETKASLADDTPKAPFEVFAPAKLEAGFQFVVEWNDRLILVSVVTLIH